MKKTDMGLHQGIAYLKRMNQKQKKWKILNFDAQYLLKHTPNKLDNS